MIFAILWVRGRGYLLLMRGFFDEYGVFLGTVNHVFDVLEAKNQFIRSDLNKDIPIKT